MKRFLVYLVSAILFIPLVGCVSYSKEVRKALKRSYAYDFSKYYFRGTPVGNFGIGTAYFYNAIKGGKPTPKSLQEEWLIFDPDNWYVDTLSDLEKKELNDKIIKSGTLGSFSIDENISIIFCSK